MTEPLRLEGVTVAYRRVVACEDITLTVAPGSVYALLGHEGSGKSSLVQCILGRQKPSAGRALVLGEDAWKARRRLSARVGPNEGAELLVLDEPPPGFTAPGGPPGTAFLAAREPARLAGIATHVGILKRGRLVLDKSTEALASDFRRIRYVNRLTETRTSFGTELDAFDAVRVRVRGWGIEAVVSNFESGAFERFQQIDGVENAEQEAMTLAEIFLAVAGEKANQGTGPAQ